MSRKYLTSQIFIRDRKLELLFQVWVWFLNKPCNLHIALEFEYEPCTLNGSPIRNLSQYFLLTKPVIVEQTLILPIVYLIVYAEMAIVKIYMYLFSVRSHR